jgi:hypothetical protein
MRKIAVNDSHTDPCPCEQRCRRAHVPTAFDKLLDLAFDRLQHSEQRGVGMAEDQTAGGQNALIRAPTSFPTLPALDL